MTKPKLEVACDGSEDLIPSELYTRVDAERAFEDARWVHERASTVVGPAIA